MNYIFENWKLDSLSPDEKIIKFEEEKYVGLEDLLNSTNTISLDDILTKINLVLNGESCFEEIGNERSMAEIKKEKTEIYDLFDGLIPDESLNSTIIIETEKLKSIIVEFKKVSKK
ncbi:hypothetical protein [Carnobacterium divergens]|uniref:hypothetical protein n=1 Tax=Carnobacterium divergens TaxID=2748 RepID=UPI0039AEEFD6